MSQEVTSLVVGVDTTQVKTAAQALDEFAKSGKNAETASTRLERAFAEMLAETRGISTGVQELVRLAAAANSTAVAAGKIAPALSTVEASAQAARGAVAGTATEFAKVGASGTNAATKATTAFGQATRQIDAAARAAMQANKAFDAFGGLGVAKAPSKDLDASAQQIAKVAPAATSAAGALASANAQIGSLGQTTKLSAFQTQQLSYQLNDLFVQIASGQSPLTALIQQGSQLSGTFNGVGGTLRAIGSLFTATRVAVGGFATAAAALGYAVYKGNEESRAFANSLLLTGNAAGLTEGRFNSLGRSIADSTKTGVGTAREVLQGLVSTGQYSGEALSETARAALLFGKATGTSTQDVLKGFSEMRGGVARWAEETNRQYHFLTAAQLEYVRTLEEQGNSQKAVAVTMAALSERVGGAAANVGLLERAWNAAAKAASNFGDAVKSVGRQSTPDESIVELERQIKYREEVRSKVLAGGLGVASSQESIDGLKEQLTMLKRLRDAQTDVATQKQKEADLEQARIARDKIVEANLNKRQQLTKELARVNAIFDKAGDPANDPRRLQALANVREKFYTAPVKTSLASDLSKIKTGLETLTGLYEGAESILEATRAAGLIDEREYYEAKRQFLALNSGAQIKALQDENARIAAEKITGQSAVEIANKRQEAQKTIAENTARIGQIQQEAAAKGVVLTLQQTSAMAALKKSYEEARISAEEYLATLTKQGQRDVAAVGQSDKQRSSTSGRAQIEERYEQQRRELENNKRLLEFEGKFTETARQQYEERLAIINEFQAKATSSWEQTYKAIGDQEALWTNGTHRAFQNYIEESANAAKQSEAFFSKAIGGIEDALANFVMTGKLNFKNLATSIIADLVRIQLKADLSKLFGSAGGQSAIGSIGGLLGGLFGGGAGAAAKDTGGFMTVDGSYAVGGPVSAGRLVQVNEKGPELLNSGGKQYLMMGSQPGTITPNGAAQGTGGTIINNHIAAGVQKGEMEQSLLMLSRSMRAEFDKKLARAGIRT